MSDVDADAVGASALEHRLDYFQARLPRFRPSAAEAGGNHRDAQAVFHRIIDHGAHDHHPLSFQYPQYDRP